MKKDAQSDVPSEVRGALDKLAGSEKDRQKIDKWVETSAKRQAELEVLIRKQELDFTTVLEMANSLNAKSLDDRGLESFLAYITSTTRGQFGVSNVFIMRQLDSGHPTLTLHGRRAQDKTTIEFDAGSAFAKRMRQIREPFFINGADGELQDFEEISRLKKNGVEVCVPLVRSDESAGTDLKGLLCLGRKLLGGEYGRSELKFMGLLGEMIAISLHNAQLHRKSIIDSLTNVYSRGHFDLHLESEISRAERYTCSEPPDAVRYVTLIMMDVDYFKKFNDAYGHKAGDAALIVIAKLLSGNLRRSDVVARYGGEEFAIIAPEVIKPEGVRLAERLRTKIEKNKFEHEDNHDISITASFSVGTYPVDARDIRGLIAVADKALYAAKAQGRNRVTPV
ncbi:MAG: sensor domain-containing diguanylate cyclase [Planctomycetota bacterium]|nr:sensor domain-containing diguanylate cyclase [Planctomycetota bacterium]